MSFARLLGILGGLVCMAGGGYLLMIKAAQENSILESIAHGIGIYCIGKGMYVLMSSEFMSRLGNR